MCKIRIAAAAVKKLPARRFIRATEKLSRTPGAGASCIYKNPKFPSIRPLPCLAVFHLFNYIINFTPEMIRNLLSPRLFLLLILSNILAPAVARENSAPSAETKRFNEVATKLLSDRQVELPIIPRPRSAIITNNGYKLSIPPVISMTVPQPLKSEGDYLMTRLKAGLGRTGRLEPEGFIQLSLAPGFPKEGYRLVIDGNNIKISATDSAGIFYGVQTLLQLMPAQVYGTSNQQIPVQLPYVTIEDAPEKEWRGMLLDPARHFMPKEFVIKFLHLMAMQKMNRLHFHAIDREGWRIEIKKYPKLAEITDGIPASFPSEDPTDHSRPASPEGSLLHGGGYYTQKDIKEIVAVASSLHITVIPEVEIPGHNVAMLTAYPQFSTTGKIPQPSRNVLPLDLVNVDEKSIQFLKDILDEITELFPGKYIHLGGDEAPMNQWNESKFVQDRIKALKLKSSHELQSWLFAELAKHIAKKGRIAIGWEEISYGFVPPGTVIMPWISENTAVGIANADHPVVLCTEYPFYFDSKQTANPTDQQTFKSIRPMRAVYNYSFSPPGLKPEKSKNILGGQAQLWGELTPLPQHVEWNAFPRSAALAEATWTPTKLKNYKNFSKRLVAQTQRWDVMKVNYCPLETSPFVVDWSPTSVASGGKNIVIQDEVPGRISKGVYEAVVTYEGGSYGMWFNKIELVADGVVIASDEHRGFTGIKPTNASYTLNVVKDLPENAEVSLRASLDSSEGTDSSGGITFRKK